MKRRWASALIALLATGALWLPAVGGEAGKMTFRDLARKYFHDGEGNDLAKVVGYADPVKKVLALEYRVLLFDNNKETPVDPKTHEFHLGDRVRVLVQPLNDYYVYIYMMGPTGNSGFLLPTKDEHPPLAKAGQPVALPNDGFLQFEPPPGTEQLFVVATEKPVADRDILGRVLSKKPGEPDTPEEKAVRDTLKATIKEALKSVRERQQEVMEKTVMWRGLSTSKARQELIDDVRSRGVTEGTFEEPTAAGTTAVYLSTQEQVQPRLLVSIPLKSLAAKR